MKSLVCIFSNSSVCVRIDPSMPHIHLIYELYDHFCIIYVYLKYSFFWFFHNKIGVVHREAENTAYYMYCDGLE
jgi:hypothetical protein